MRSRRLRVNRRDPQRLYWIVDISGVATFGVCPVWRRRPFRFRVYSERSYTLHTRVNSNNIITREILIPLAGGGGDVLCKSILSSTRSNAERKKKKTKRFISVSHSCLKIPNKRGRYIYLFFFFFIYNIHRHLEFKYRRNWILKRKITTFSYPAVPNRNPVIRRHLNFFFYESYYC